MKKINILFITMFIGFGANLFAMEQQRLNQQLIDAAREGRNQDVEQLIEQGADVNAKDRVDSVALIWAAAGGHDQVVKTLLDNGADVNVKGSLDFTALMWAVDKGHDPVVKTLLDNKADVNAKHWLGSTALHIAVFNGNKEIIESLLEVPGIDLTLTNNEGKTAYDLARTDEIRDLIRQVRLRRTKGAHKRR